MSLPPFATLRSIGLLHKGHFVYTSGRHGEWYVRLDKGGYIETPELSELCLRMAQFSDSAVQVVIGPATGGTTIAKLVAGHLSGLLPHEVRFLSLEKKAGENTFGVREDEAPIIKGQSILLVDDVLTTGKTLCQLIRVVRDVGGIVIGVSVVWNRGEVSAKDLGVPWIFAPIDQPLPSYSAEDCPLCAKRIPINTDMGHGLAFLKRKE